MLRQALVQTMFVGKCLLLSTHTRRWNSIAASIEHWYKQWIIVFPKTKYGILPAIGGHSWRKPKGQKLWPIVIYYVIVELHCEVIHDDQSFFCGWTGRLRRTNGVHEHGPWLTLFGIITCYGGIYWSVLFQVMAWCLGQHRVINTINAGLSLTRSSGSDYVWMKSKAFSWWRHHFRVTDPLWGEFTGHRPVTRSFDVFFDLRLNKRLSKQSWSWWFETPSRSLWRHCNVVGRIFVGS